MLPKRFWLGSIASIFNVSNRKMSISDQEPDKIKKNMYMKSNVIIQKGSV